MDEDYSKTEHIFNQAADLRHAEERAAYLDEACGVDQKLRAAVERLLKHDSDAGSFLDAPAVDFAAAAETIDQPITEGPGTIIGPYKLLQKIGEGGFGVVHMADQTEPVKRRVALKVIKPGMDSKQVVSRFEAERQALAMMDHPCIARVFDGGSTESGRPYFVMELVNGMPVTDYCDRYRFTMNQRLELFIQVCQAVQHAHQKGVIHRDIKPSNVLVSQQDGHAVPKVIDFGIAKAISGNLTDATLVTNFAQMIGTPLYMSPEQAEPGGLDIDTRSDVYSLGVVLYELLIGTTPFDHERLKEVSYDELRRIIREEDPPRPSTRLTTLDAALDTVAEKHHTDSRTLIRQVSGELDWIVMKALEKDRTRRYETANGFARDIQRYLDDAPVEACPPSKVYRLRKFARRNKTAVVASTAVALALIVGAAIATDQAIRATEAGGLAEKRLTVADKQRRLAKRQEQLALEQKQLAEEAVESERQLRAEVERQRDSTEQNLYVAHMRLAQKDWEDGQIARFRDLLDRHLPLPGRPDLRGWEWYYWFSLCFKGSKTLDGHARGADALAWSPDGTRLASAQWSGAIIIWDPEDGTQVRTLRTPDNVAAGWLGWSPDGRLLAGKCGARTVIWDAESGLEQLTIQTASGRSHAWSPDGKRLATPGREQTVVIWDATTGKEVRRLAGHDTEVIEVAWSPDGKRIAASGFEPNTITIWDTETGEIQGTLKGSGFIYHLAWNPESTRLLSGGRGGPLKVWDPIGRRELLSLEHNGPVIWAAWSPDGREIATGIRGHTITLWDATSGKKLRELRGHSANIRSVVWSPDGERLASGDRAGIVKIWDAHEEQETLTVAEDAVRGDCRIFFSPVDRQLAYYSVDGSIKICDATTGKQIHTLRGPGFYGPFWSPNGKHLACSGADDSIAIYDTETGKQIQTWTDESDRGQPLIGLSARPFLAWHPDGRQLASVSVINGTVKIWDALTGKELSSFDPCSPGASQYHWTVAWSPDGERLATGDANGVIEIWDRAGWRKLHSIRAYGHNHTVSFLAFSPDGRYLATGGDSFEPIVKVWDTFTARAVRSIKGHTGSIRPLLWSPDGRQIASAGGDACRVWDAKTGQELFALPDHTGVAWSHDGKCIATISGGKVKVYDASIGYKMAYKMETDSTYLCDRACRLSETGRHEEAIAILQKLVEEFPDAPEYPKELARAYFGQGDVPFHKGDLEKAFPDLDQAIRLNPEYSEALDHRGKVYLQRGDLDKAIADFDKAIQFGAAYGASSYASRGVAYFCMGKFDEAMADLTKAIESAPNVANYWYCRALVRLAAHDVGGYRSDCAGMLDSFGQTKNPNAGQWVAWTFALAPDAVADFSRAIALAKQAVESDPKSSFYLNALGAVLYRAGRLKEAIQRLSEADGLVKDTKSRSSPTYIWYFLAMAHHKLENDAEAEKRLDKAVKWTAKVLREHEEGTSTLAWNRKLTLKLLREEAGAMLEKSGDKSPEEGADGDEAPPKEDTEPTENAP
jgi:eukaryotic-like serine/threonine-protein kinase